MYVALGVCSIGSESLTLPVTLVKVPWDGAFSLAEAERAELGVLGLHSWSLNAFHPIQQLVKSALPLACSAGAIRSTQSVTQGAPRA